MFNRSLLALVFVATMANVRTALADPSHCTTSAIGRQTHDTYKLIGEELTTTTIGIPPYQQQIQFYRGFYEGPRLSLVVNCATGDVISARRINGLEDDWDSCDYDSEDLDFDGSDLSDDGWTSAEQ